jgi:hypothetical protein
MYEDDQSQIDLLGGAKKALGAAVVIAVISGALTFTSESCSQFVADLSTAEAMAVSVSFSWSSPANLFAIVASSVTALAALSALALIFKAKSFEEPTTDALAKLKRGKLILGGLALLILAQSGARLYDARPHDYEITKVFREADMASIEEFRAAKTCGERYAVLKR